LRKKLIEISKPYPEGNKKARPNSIVNKSVSNFQMKLYVFTVFPVSIVNNIEPIEGFKLQCGLMLKLGEV
jgi:hypothetical protein